MGTFKHFYELTKPRLSFLSVFSALVAYGIAPKTAVASTSLGDLAYALLVAVGIALCAGGAAVLNQWLEYPLDDLMQQKLRSAVYKSKRLQMLSLITSTQNQHQYRMGSDANVCYSPWPEAALSHPYSLLRSSRGVP